ncbi:MAG: hypothetical protein OXG78_06355 [Chloroflexi bacterium]|nr:hypothetical protein [Chloroflexota bacterium]
MTPSILKVFYTIAVFIVGASLALLFIVPPDSAEYVVTLLSACVGAVLLILVALTTWFINR